MQTEQVHAAAAEQLQELQTQAPEASKALEQATAPYKAELLPAIVAIEDSMSQVLWLCKQLETFDASAAAAVTSASESLASRFHDLVMGTKESTQRQLSHKLYRDLEVVNLERAGLGGQEEHTHAQLQALEQRRELAAAASQALKESLGALTTQETQVKGELGTLSQKHERAEKSLAVARQQSERATAEIDEVERALVRQCPEKDTHCRFTEC